MAVAEQAFHLDLVPVAGFHSVNSPVGIYATSPDGSDLTRLTDMGDSESWSPDGGYLGFRSARSGNAEIMRCARTEAARPS